MGLTRVGFVAVVLLAAGACGQAPDVETTASSESPVASPTRTPKAGPTSRAEESPPFEEPHTRIDAKTRARLFPPGYPKVVPVSSLPFELRHGYNAQTSRAVALAPGVWTPLPAGSTMMDVATMGRGDGRCAAVRAYEDEFLGGRHLDGDCW